LGERGLPLLFYNAFHTSKSKGSFTYFMFSPSVAGEQPTMASADFCCSISMPRSMNSLLAEQQTSQGNARDLHTYACLIYVRSFWISIGL